MSTVERAKHGHWELRNALASAGIAALLCRIVVRERVERGKRVDVIHVCVLAAHCIDKLQNKTLNRHPLAN